MQNIQVILFDWGDTVMRDFREYEGPMAQWPRVEAVPGIEPALKALRGRFRLAIATNAPVSGENLVRAALDRVGLQPYFSEIFTTRELGVRKPDKAYFQKVLDRLGLQAHQVAMVGDDYPIDIAGAKAAGLRAVWFNAAGAPTPDVHPYQDAEVLRLADLPEVFSGKKLPDVQECLDWLSQQGANAGLLSHCQAVAVTAYRLALWVRDAGEVLDPLLAHRGGLLHDLDKQSSGQIERHGQHSAELLRAWGQPALAEIAARHNLLTLEQPTGAPRTWEERLVFYADKLVEGGRFVGLETRFASLRLRYPSQVEVFERLQPRVEAMEEELSSLLDLSVETMYDRLEDIEF